MGDSRSSADVPIADWLAVSRRAVTGAERALASLATTAERQIGTGRGAGGDNTLAIDKLAEDAIFDVLQSMHEQGHDFLAISEERGEVQFGRPGRVRVVIDPIDGSLNAKRLLPTVALSIAVASGETMEDVEVAFVHDFGSGEEFAAARRRGATLNGRPLDPDAGGDELEIVGFESARPGLVGPVAQRLADSVYRMRVIGTIATSLCYVAAARFDGLITMTTCRSVDAAAGQLIAREAGAFVSVLGHGGLEAPLDLGARFRVAAARTPENLETLVGALVDTGIPE
jgi:myo-inositol-1(or 4)-monophosphatase